MGIKQFTWIFGLLILIVGACKTEKQNKENLAVKLISETKKISPEKHTEVSNILSYEVDPKKQNLAFYWKDKNGKEYKNFKNLKASLAKEKKELTFAMNGGMYNKDGSPQGLYIENGIRKTKLDTVQNAFGNFYLQPNGIFYLTKTNEAFVCTTKKFEENNNILYATQSGPMLLIDGTIHPKLTEGSVNLNIRNGVGILPSGNILFAMSKNKINFFDFATYFKKQACENALYLDGLVSKTYLPAKKWEDLEANFGVIIGEVK